MTESSLGFARKKLDISGFQPRPLQREHDIDDREAADKVAEKAGFVSREPFMRLERTRKAATPQDFAYVRGPVDLINRFKQHCNNTGLSYGAALEEMMNRLGI